MSIETRTLFVDYPTAVVSLNAVIAQHRRYYEANLYSKSEESTEIALVLRDDRTVWVDVKKIQPNSILYDSTHLSTAALSIESGSGRTQFEAALLYAIPHIFLQQRACIGVNDPQKNREFVNDPDGWQTASLDYLCSYYPSDKSVGERIWKELTQDSFCDCG